ncbi:lasso peptide [Leptothoe sp. EHU-05/26/07-4]
MKKTYTQPSLTAYGSVQQLTQGNGTIAIGDSIIFTDIPGPNGKPEEVQGFGSVDIEIPDNLAS